MTDYNGYLTVLSHVPRLFISLGTRLDSQLFKGLHGKSVLHLSSERGILVMADKWQYTLPACKRSVETAERCRSSWVHMPNLPACSFES